MSSIYKLNDFFYYQGKKSDGTRTQFSLKTKDKKRAVELQNYYDKKLSGISLSELFDKWHFHILSSSHDYSARYILDMQNIVKEFSAFVNTDSITTLNPDDIYNFNMHLHEINNNQSTRGRKLRTLRVLFRFALKHGYILEDLFTKVKVRNAIRRTAFLTVDQIKHLIQSAESHNKLYALYIKFICFTGCRAGEFCKLKWTDINDDVIVFNGKTGERKFPNSDKIKSILNDIQGKIKSTSIYIYTDTSGNYIGHNTENLSKMVKRELIRAGFTDSNLTTHSLRHSFASNLIMQGVMPLIVSRLLGHKSLAITDTIYTHLQPDYLKNFMDLY